MKKFLIATHGELSRELVDTSKLIIGSLTNIEYFCMTTDKSADDAEKEIRSILSNNKDRICCLNRCVWWKCGKHMYKLTFTRVQI